MRIDYTGTGNTTYALSFTYDPAGRPLTVNRHSAAATATFYYRTNMRGDVTEITDSSGAKVASYAYDPWGTVTDSWSATGQSIKDQNPLRYAGYIYDQQAGLYYLRARWYAPSLARFMTKDSPAIEGTIEPKGSNRYVYAEDNPTGFTDHNGLRRDVSGRRRKAPMTGCLDYNGPWGDQSNYSRWSWRAWLNFIGSVCDIAFYVAKCWRDVTGGCWRNPNCAPWIAHSWKYHRHTYYGGPRR